MHSGIIEGTVCILLIAYLQVIPGGVVDDRPGVHIRVSHSKNGKISVGPLEVVHHHCISPCLAERHVPSLVGIVFSDVLVSLGEM
jgi:hypothetical protein